MNDDEWGPSEGDRVLCGSDDDAVRDRLFGLFFGEGLSEDHRVWLAPADFLRVFRYLRSWFLPAHDTRRMRLGFLGTLESRDLMNERELWIDVSGSVAAGTVQLLVPGNEPSRKRAGRVLPWTMI